MNGLTSDRTEILGLTCLTVIRPGPYDSVGFPGVKETFKSLEARLKRSVLKGYIGDIAQLGERGVRNAEAEGASPSISTIMPL